jgi:hypothetical protein
MKRAGTASRSGSAIASGSVSHKYGSEPKCHGSRTLLQSLVELCPPISAAEMYEEFKIIT